MYYNFEYMQKEWDGIYKMHKRKEIDLMVPIKSKEEENKAIKKHSKYRGKKEEKSLYISLSF